MSAHTAEPEGRIDYAKTLDMPTKRLILFGVLVGLFLSALDQTIVSTALPRITQELNGLSLYSWVTTAYLLTNTALVPIYGKLSDLYGRKPILMIGIVIFLIGSALCGLAGEPFLGNLFGGGMMQLDANKDQAITLAEFEAGALERFGRNDTNKDGKVTQDERKAAREAMKQRWQQRRAAPQG